MREICKVGGGNVVAAVVAVLEKQQAPNGSTQFSSTSYKNIPPRYVPSSQHVKIQPSTEQNTRKCSPAPLDARAKNKHPLENATIQPTSADENFQSAVKYFDSIAEDVQQIVAKSNSLKRSVNPKIDLNYASDSAEEATTPVNNVYYPIEENTSLRNNFEVIRAHSLKTVPQKWDFNTRKDYYDQQQTNSLDRNREKNREVIDSNFKFPHLRVTQQRINSNYPAKDIVIHVDPPSLSSISNHSIDDFLTVSSRVVVPPSRLDPNVAFRESQKDGNEAGNEFLTYEDKLKRLSGGTDSSVSDELQSSSSSGSEDSESGRVHVINEGLATIIEEERNTASSAQSYSRDNDGNDSTTPEDESTLKGHNPEWSENGSTVGSTSDLSSSSSSDRPRNIRDSSTRCNSDFQWIRKDEPTSPKMDDHQITSVSKPPINRSNREKQSSRRDKAGSLDRRRHLQQTRQERDQKSRSTHVKSPPRLDDFKPCDGWCCNPHENVCFENFRRRHETTDPQRYGSNPMLMEQRGSHPDIYGDCNRYRHDMLGCCNYHMAPPCYFYGDRGYRWTPPPYFKPGEQDEKLRKLQYEKDNLQLQVQVLTEQIEAQSDKISDLEKALHDRKQVLSDAEDKLQREVLSRSSLETQKLELMSIISDLKLQQAALERENIDLRNSHYNNNGDLKKPPLIPRISPQPQHTSTPIHHNSNQALNVRLSPSPSPVCSGQMNNIRRSDSNSTMQDVQPPKTPPANYKRQIDIHYGSLPRQQFLSNGGNMSLVDSNANPSANGRKGVAFGRGLTTFIGVRARGLSVPNLAQTEKILIDVSNDSSQSLFNKNKGIKKIFGKIKRSGSGNLEDIPGVSEFQRGGVRATAAARLGWSEPQLIQKPDKPFAEWDTENICDWLQDLGLDQYVQEAKRWIKTGQQLQESSMGDIEKELNIKNPLHKKKLQLALIDTEENASSDPHLKKAGELDTAWVLRWLDDAGLPQHKENFLINRVDGRVLHRLTVDDLGLLHVTSMLHVSSIKRGIQVLRENNYEAACLQRRSLPEESQPATPKQVSLWTTHRVMEWLRAVDLAEYAPNLRGAGVHGGLLVYETKFTAELLAALLSIPPGKTLLRRHLNTHFKELLGKDIIQEKREAESIMGYIPLTPSAKLKVAKKSQFSLKRKKSKGEADYGDLVCPLDPEKYSGELNGSALNNSMGITKMENLGAEDVYHLVEKAVKSLPASVASSPIPLRHV